MSKKKKKNSTIYRIFSTMIKLKISQLLVQFRSKTFVSLIIIVS